MKYNIVTYFTDENGNKFYVGDIVTIHFPSGGGLGRCEITKITNTGFHFSQGAGRVKSVQFKEIDHLEKMPTRDNSIPSDENKHYGICSDCGRMDKVADLPELKDNKWHDIMLCKECLLSTKDRVKKIFIRHTDELNKGIHDPIKTALLSKIANEEGNN